MEDYWNKGGIGPALEPGGGSSLAATMLKPGKKLAVDDGLSWWDKLSPGEAIATSNAALTMLVHMMKGKQERREQEILSQQKLGEVQQDGYLALADRIQGIGKGGTFTAQPSNVNLA